MRISLQPTTHKETKLLLAPTMPIPGGTIINISGTSPVDDPEYRYKMPAVYGKVEGSGNGIKTAIPNISDVAMSLRRSSGEVNKFFGCELGAQTTYSEETDRAIVNGSHTDDTLQKLVHRYVEGFVLCPNCGLPETEYKIKNGTIWHKCAACGAKEMVDMNHKLTNYILAQDKKAKKSKDEKSKKEKLKEGNKDDSDGEKKKKSKKDKRSKKDKKKENSESAENEEEGGDNDDKGYLKEAIFGKKDDVQDLVGVEGGTGSYGESSEAGVDDEGAMNLAVEGTRKFLLSNPYASADAIIEVVTNEQMASSLKAHDKIHILIRAAITPEFFKNEEIQQYSNTASRILNGNKILERHLISSLEFVSKDKPKNFPVMIKQFYDEDVLDEETILEWAEDGRSEYTREAVDEEIRAVLRGQAEPVVVWLQEADSEDEDDSE